MNDIEISNYLTYYLIKTLFTENFMSTIKNLLTFGAHGRVEEKIMKYKKVRNKYDSKLKKMKVKSRKVNEILKTVVEVKIEAIKILNSFKEFSVDNIEKELYSSNIFKPADFKHIDQTLDKGQLALTATAGVTVGATAGVGAALATWGLASTFGAASTGTAISTLSGAAATNATLALLGGGSLATGGGGILAGATVLGGIVAIPALVALGVFSHFSAKKKIAEIETAIYKMNINMYKMDTNIIRLKIIEKKANRLIRLIKKKSYILNYELNIAYKIVNAEMNKISSFYHQVRILLFNRSVWKLANDLSILIDTPIFDENTEKVHLNRILNTKKGYKVLTIFSILAALSIFAVVMIKNTFSLNIFSKSYDKEIIIEAFTPNSQSSQFETEHDMDYIGGVVIDYVAQLAESVNYGDASGLQWYLEPDSNFYAQQMNLVHNLNSRNIQEYVLNTQISDVRQLETNTFEADSYEQIEIVKEGVSEIKEFNWTYTIIYDGTDYYISNLR